MNCSFLNINDDKKLFDKRGIFIIVTKSKIFLLFGSEIENKLKSQIAAYKYIEKLKQYEKAPDDLVELNEKDIMKWLNNDLEDIDLDDNNDEDIEEFISLFPNRFTNDIFIKNEKWDSWYNYQPKDKTFTIGINNNSSPENYDKKAFYVYPDYSPTSMMDVDDLDPEEIYVVLSENSESRKLFIWKSDDNNENDEKLSIYINNLKGMFFSSQAEIEVIEEMPLDESYEFLKLL